MRFLFVDKINAFTDLTIAGEKTFAADAPMQYRTLYRKPEIAPSAVSEAVGQLVSWLCLSKNNFSARPVFMFADAIEICGPVYPGETVQLSAVINEESEEDSAFVFSGEARVGDRLVHRIVNCNGYFMPLAELEDPDVARMRFSDLKSNGLTLDGDHGYFDFDQLAGEILQAKENEVAVCRKTMDGSSRFFRDHFPRNPVTPIVIINEMIGKVTEKMLHADRAGRLRIRMVTNIKIRNFIRPGETVDTTVAFKGIEKTPGGEILHTIATIMKEGKPILKGKYQYDII